MGKIGSLEGVKDVVKNAAEIIENGEVEPGKITKSVLVIDKAQDMDIKMYEQNLSNLWMAFLFII